MYTHLSNVLSNADDAAATDERVMYKILRGMPVEDFVHCIFYAPRQFPNVYGRLPRLPSAEIQRNYVGNDGTTLEHMTAAFVRNLRGIVQRRFPNGFPYDGKILDYGCGWGRIIRMMPYFTEPKNLFAVDPMQKSLDLCRELNVTGTFSLCQILPDSVPFSPIQFDLVYAFSVFTHLSEEVSRAVLRAVRERITDRGTFVITIRPSEFWEVVTPRYGAEETARLRRAHLADEFAFIPSEQLRYEGKATYGDSSMSLTVLTRMARECGWSLDPTHERSLVDPFQLIYALYPAA